MLKQKKGFYKFHQKYFASQNSLYHRLAKKQSPKVMVVGCSDARVDPAILTNASPGDLFVVRNIANIIPSYAEAKKDSLGAAIEYGVCFLGVESIVVLGHSDCGGIKYLFSESDRGMESIEKWMAHARAQTRAHGGSIRGSILGPIRKKEECTIITDNEKVRSDYEKKNILFSLENLKKFPYVSSQITAKKIQLYGWYFSIADGLLLEYKDATDDFEIIV